MTREGPSYRERQRVQVQCRECGEEMADVYLSGYMMTQHGQAAEERCSWTTPETGEEPQTYRMAFQSKGCPRICPMEGCPGRAATRTAMWVHFLHRHVRDTMVVLEEGTLPHPWCPQCNILVPWRTLNGIHPATAQCARGAERRRRKLAKNSGRPHRRPFRHMENLWKMWWSLYI